MAKVFISYVREDRPTADVIYGLLSDLGHCPWMDEHNLLPGQNWKREIKEAMRSADFVIVCLSHHSVTKKGYFQKEVKTALEFYELLPEGHTYLIPVRLDDCPVPTSLHDTQWLDWTSPTAVSRLAAALLESAQPEDAEEHSMAVPTDLSDLRFLKQHTTVLHQHRLTLNDIGAVASEVERFSLLAGQKMRDAQWEVLRELLRRKEIRTKFFARIHATDPEACKGLSWEVFEDECNNWIERRLPEGGEPYRAFIHKKLDGIICPP